MRRAWSLAFFSALLMGAAACDSVSGNQDAVPDWVGNGARVTGQPVGSPCSNNDPNHFCLALKYVVYTDANNAPIVSSQQAITNLQTINTIWSQCNVGFEIVEYVPVNPADHGLPDPTSNYADLDAIRTGLEESNSFLVTTTHTWNRAGTLGQASANAWTAMPGGPPYGTVLERPVATYANIIAHELGHYMNLVHVSDTSNLMNPIIYQSSTYLSSSQCSTVRAAIPAYWGQMMR